MFRRIAIAIAATATLATAATPVAQAAPPRHPGNAPIVIQTQPEKPGVSTFRSSWS